MSDEPTTEVLRRLGEYSSQPRPLGLDAQRRIHGRMGAAFEREAITEVGRAPTDLPYPAELEPQTTGSWRPPRTLAAASIAIVLVVGAALMARFNSGASDLAVEVGPASDDLAEFTDAPRWSVGDAMLRAGARWDLVGDGPHNESGSIPSLAVRIADGSLATGDSGVTVVSGTARVSTAGAPPLQYQGAVRFEIDEHGRVEIPIALLDPASAWVECDATIDLFGFGVETCAANTVTYTSTLGSTEEVATPVGIYEATRIVVAWQLSKAAPQRTTVWHAPTIGPVRIDVETDGVPATYELHSLETPTTEEPGG